MLDNSRCEEKYILRVVGAGLTKDFFIPISEDGTIVFHLRLHLFNYLFLYLAVWLIIYSWNFIINYLLSSLLASCFRLITFVDPASPPADPVFLFNHHYCLNGIIKFCVLVIFFCSCKLKVKIPNIKFKNK